MAGQLDPIQLMRKIAELEDKINAMRTIEVGGVWQDYAVAWTAATTNPDIGNGLLIGKYCIIGKTSHVSIRLQARSTTTFGSGNYFLSIPIAAKNNGIGFAYLGVGHIRNNGIASYPVIIQLEPYTNATKTTYIIVTTAGTTALYWTPTAPFTFGNTDLFWMNLTYEIA